ncbi:hypothetical protein [Phenylobacterium sp.]|uniref:hypothetical protein n=1 Tax=Phenylobacterium sp. TaxID=1871053 RepID=UPI003D2A6AC3
MSEVNAANYAFALDAGLAIIDPIPDDVGDALLERLYGILDQREQSPGDVFREVVAELRSLIGPIELPPNGSITWISRRLPLGLAYPELPSSHLFTYPDLGVSIANGFAAEQPGTPGVSVAALVDPGTTEASEIIATARALAERRVLVRSVHGPAANVTDVAMDVDHFPYDLLMFSTHCGDVSGYRWTYEFDDAEGIGRRLVVDIALGIGRPLEGHDDRLMVTEMIYHRSLDGVDWNDPDKAKKVYIGSAIKDFHDLRAASEPLEPVLREKIERVVGSAALQMYDDNYIPMSHSVAAHNTPIIFNNACTSWRELCSRFMFAGARAYVGTVIPVMDGEAADVARGMFVKHYGKPLGHALWATQNDVYGGGVRRPYVATGVYPQRLRTTARDTPRIVLRRLEKDLKAWNAMADRAEKSGDPETAERFYRVARYYESEVKNWPFRRAN